MGAISITIISEILMLGHIASEVRVLSVFVQASAESEPESDEVSGVGGPTVQRSSSIRA